MFKPRLARRSLARYRKKGLDALERQMLASIPPGELADASVLEIGGGVGTIQSELLAAGAQRGEIVELAPAYEPYARALARERGFEERTTFRIADILDDPEAVDSARIVVLNRVVCCSPDGVRLTGVAARLTQGTLVLSFPRDRFLVRAGLRLVNGWLRMLGRSFRVFFHPPGAVLAAAEAQGLRVASRGRLRLWEFASLQRVR
jgi:magnesium-protoporphyrin O-methyltransferase